MSSKTYKPPKVGDVCYIRKTFKSWSSNTLVKIVATEVGPDMVRVVHEPTNHEFDIPIDYLVKRRNRAC